MLISRVLLHVVFVPFKRSLTHGPEIRSRFLHTVRDMKMRDNILRLLESKKPIFIFLSN